MIQEITRISYFEAETNTLGNNTPPFKVCA